MFKENTFIFRLAMVILTVEWSILIKINSIIN
jgi:hypothetical protein